MSETPRDLFPPTSESAVQMADALKKALTTEDRASLEEALRYAKGEAEPEPRSKPKLELDMSDFETGHDLDGPDPGWYWEEEDEKRW